MLKKEIKVIIIDDDMMTRKVLAYELSKDAEVKVVATAKDAYEGRDKIVYFSPDVVLLDIQMPRVNGLSLLKQLMKYKPIPVIIMSSFNNINKGEYALRAMELGAMEVISKPDDSYPINEMKDQLIEKIKAVGQIKSKKKLNFDELIPANIVNSKGILSKDKIIAIGASTGGTIAIKEVLSKLPANIPPIVIVQHMPKEFTHSFAQHLNEICAIEVAEAKDNEVLKQGRALLAPGNKHMVLKRRGSEYVVSLKDGPLVYFQRPAVELLFNSIAKNVKNKAIGVILTGMGKDGAEGLLRMRNAGAYTIGQDENSSTVYGMPKEAYNLGAVMKQLPLGKIPEYLVYLSQKRGRTRRVKKVL